jgi:predicted Zn-dependent protease
MQRCFLALICSYLSLLAQADPQNTPEALYSRGRLYAKLSVQALNELRKTAPESAYAFALRGEIKAQEHQYSMALEAYHEALKRMPNLRGVQSAMASVLVASGKPADASLSEASEAKLSPPDCTIEKFYCDFKAGRFESVVEAAKSRKDAEGLYWLARSYHALAAQTFAELSNLPESAELHKFTAQKLRDEGRYQESAGEWRAAVRLSPSDRILRRELATALFLSQDYREVLPELQQLLRADPDSANLNFFVGDSLLETEQIDAAIPYLKAALELDPKLIPAHVALGLCYVHVGDPQRAIPHIKLGLKLDRDGSLYYQLARAYQATGQPGLAKPMMEKYQQLQKQASAAGRVP